MLVLLLGCAITCNICKCIFISSAALETRSAQHDLAVAISRSLAHIWHALQDQLVHRVAEIYTDLVGPLRQLSEAACPSAGGLPNEGAFNDQMKVFLVRLGILLSLQVFCLILSCLVFCM